MRRRYKWLDTELSKMDPEIDYERMIGLYAGHRLNEFVMNISYATSFMNVIQAPHGSHTLIHTRKVLDQQQKRFEDSLDFFWTWYLDGPSSEAARKMTTRLNRMHAHVAKQLPGNFSDNDDFLQPLALMGLFGHRLEQQLGLPGMSPSMQTAFHHFLRDLSTLFVTETGPIKDFPDDFDGLLSFAESFEVRDWRPTNDGYAASNALIQQFCDRWFPPRLHGVGRSVLLTFTPETVRRAHGLQDPDPVVRRLTLVSMRTMMQLQKILPDPRKSVVERKSGKNTSPALRRRREAITSQDSAAHDSSNCTLQEQR